MAGTQKLFDHMVCYGVVDRVTFSNGEWLGENIPESERKATDINSCPLMWDFLVAAGREGWELVTVLESPGTKTSGTVRTYFLKREM